MVSAKTLMDAVKQVSHCAACGRVPEQIVQRVNVLDCGHEYEARCHGSRQVVRIEDTEIMLNQFGHFMGQMSELFPHDGFPDMIELLKYNRAPLHGWLR